MSLDGFISGPEDDMEWVFKYGDASPLVDDVIETTGALLVGRRSYDVGNKVGQAAGAQKPYGGAWTGPQFVLTHTPADTPPDPTVTFLSGDVRTAVARALRAAAGKNVVVIGANVAKQCLIEGLVDEILVHIAPVLLGDGIRVFATPGGPRVELARMDVAPSGQVTDLRFQVVK
jgi:dihydrofolate reductase